jgi:hypothetical protein
MKSLWSVIRNELGYSVDCTTEIVDAVEKWVMNQTDMVEEYEKRIIQERLWEQSK